MRDRERYGNGMEALLRVEHLKKQFHRNSDGTYVLKDISFEMMPGECLG